MLSVPLTVPHHCLLLRSNTFSLLSSPAPLGEQEMEERQRCSLFPTELPTAFVRLHFATKTPLTLLVWWGAGGVTALSPSAFHLRIKRFHFTPFLVCVAYLCFSVKSVKNKSETFTPRTLSVSHILTAFFHLFGQLEL